MELPGKAAQPSAGTVEFRLLSEVRIAKPRVGVTYCHRPIAKALCGADEIRKVLRQPREKN
jgi:hypothetical protein